MQHICVLTDTYAKLGAFALLYAAALDSKVWRQDKKTLLRPHTCCNLQGNEGTLGQWVCHGLGSDRSLTFITDITVIHNGKK